MRESLERLWNGDTFDPLRKSIPIHPLEEDQTQLVKPFFRFRKDPTNGQMGVGGGSCLVGKNDSDSSGRTYISFPRGLQSAESLSLPSPSLSSHPFSSRIK